MYRVFTKKKRGHRYFVFLVAFAKSLPMRPAIKAGILGCFLLLSCQPEQAGPEPDSLFELLDRMDSITGPEAYRESPYVTAGDRLYVVGHQDGSFPDLGWHITGEMGGIWAHPIKLLDGYQLHIMADRQTYCTVPARSFTNYPVGSVLTYEIPDAAIRWEQLQFVPDGLPGMVVEYRITNGGAQEQTLDLFFQAAVDLRPTWLGERTGMNDAPDELISKPGDSLVLVRDGANPWLAGIQTNAPRSMQLAAPACSRPAVTTGQGLTTNLRSRITLAPDETKEIRYVLAGANDAGTDLKPVLQELLAKAPTLLADRIDRYQAMTASARIDVPDPALEEAYRWTKYNTDWLRFEIPGKGTGIAAGIPDYPWWFGCDQTYTVRGLLPAGMPELAHDVLETLLELSDSTNGNGRIIHEASTNGSVYNPGNLNETPHFIATCWDYFTWTADTAFLAKAYPYCQKGINWLEEQDEDANSYPDGHGMMEIRGMDAEMIDVVAYTAEAYAAMSQIGRVMGDLDLAVDWERQAESLTRQIEDDWWVASAKSYADFRSTPGKAQQLLDDALVRADTLDKPWSVRELEAVSIGTGTTTLPYAFYHNWVVNTPLELGIADTLRALQALQTARKYINPFGTYVTGIDRKARRQDPDGFASLKSEESFNYTGAVMTLPTGVQAIAEAQYGRIDTAYDYLQRLIRSFSYAAPGSMYEVSPDYGMLAQAWNIYAIARPLIVHFLGIQPRAHERTIRIHPQLPSEWSQAGITELPIGQNTLNLGLRDQEWTASLSEPGWTIEWILPANVLEVTVNGASMATRPWGKHRMVTTLTPETTLTWEKE